MPYLLEEAYEAYAALEDGDLAALREELGDVLLQVAFHARLAEELPEGSRWTIDDVAGDLVDKLVRRHPHVFDGRAPTTSRTSWDASRRREGPHLVTEGVPLGQPACRWPRSCRSAAAGSASRCRSTTASAASCGRWWPGCREAGVDPEQALREVSRSYRDALASAEGRCAPRAASRDVEPAEWAARWLP
jgi:XTP/dITP diphosphohydrolase